MKSSCAGFWPGLLFCLFLASPLLWPQTGNPAGNDAAGNGDPAFYIGMTLTDVIRLLGVPRSVYTVRGIEEWQDDVVFVYDDAELFIIKDRVWQAALKSAYSIRAGDSGSTLILRFGYPYRSGNVNGIDFFVYPLRGYSWPIDARFNFDSDGKVSDIFIYRSDL